MLIDLQVKLSSSIFRLNEILDSFPKVMIAYSGGVDSAFLLQAAHSRLGQNRVLGVIADSPSLPRSELRAALELGKQIGAPVEMIETEEFQNPSYISNPINRCYFCKHALFEKMEALARKYNFPVLAYGENADDVQDFRPGSQAAKEFQVRAPLKEAGLTKAEIRFFSSECGLPTADKPASPCLSSRIPHGTPVTTDALQQIERGEAGIRALGFRVFRLRHHGHKAKLEFAPDEMDRLQDQSLYQQIIQTVLNVGYQEAEIDPQGYRNKIANKPTSL